MNISSINSGSQPNHSGMHQSVGSNARIRSLEQKLQTLTMEKQKAVQSKDEERKKALEKQIQEIERQIQQLRHQEEDEKKQGEAGMPDSRKLAEQPLGVGKYADIYA